MSGSAKPGSILNSSGFMVIFPPFFTDIPLVRMLFKIISSKIVIFSDSSLLKIIICPSSSSVNFKFVSEKSFSNNN